MKNWLAALFVSLAPVHLSIAGDAMAIQPFRFYSNFKFDGEHGSGANLWLWTMGGSKYMGLFSFHEGDIGYRGAMELESPQVDLKTGSISFSTTQITYGEKPEVRKSPLSLVGKIEGSQLKGTLRGKGWPEAISLTMPLEKDDMSFIYFFKPFESLEAWRANTPPKKFEY